MKNRQLMNRRASLATALALASCAACVNAKVQDAPEANLVRGTIHYTGDVHEGFSQPALLVAVFWEFPPTAPPHSSVTLPDPDFAAGPIAFELRDIPAGTYHIVATLQNGDDVFAPNNAVGSYPDHCRLSEATGVVQTYDDEPTLGIDIELFDGTGSEDPCQQNTVPCPQSGRAALLVDVSIGSRPAPSSSDQLIYGLFPAWPPAGPPVSNRILPGTALNFPTSIIDTSILPEDYVVYVCLDYGSDNLVTVCTASDAWASYPGNGLQSFAENQVVHLSFNLDDGTSQLIEVTTPGTFGCP